MKIMRHIIFSFVFILLLSSMALSDITTSVTSLAARNAEGYLAPFGTMMGTSMNSGFYRKASPHKILGFDITFDIAYGLAPPGQTTYDFVIPDDSIGYSFPFQFPKSYLATTQSNLLGNIPDAGTTDSFNDDGLFQDLELGFNLPLNMLLAVDDTKPAQNILGDSTTIPLEFDFAVAGVELKNQIVAGTWAVAKNIPGIGADYDVWLNGIEIEGGTPLATIPAAYDSITFITGFAQDTNIDSTLESTLEAMNISLPIPGGFGHFFPENFTGVPLPILQASVGLPFHTEVTLRGMPGAATLPNFGSIQYGGFGGKIGISDYLSDYLYPEKDITTFSDTNIVNIIQTNPSDILPMNVDKAISDLKLQGIDVQEIDSLNYLLIQGNPNAAIEIKNKTREALIELKSKPKSKKQKQKKFPIDLALGYYTNNLILDLDGEVPLKINSINRMISLQIGKTFNMPFISWLGGIGIYGGLGFESSNLSMSYSFVNPLSFGEESNEDEEEENIEIALDFPGDNKFRKLIGVRMRILFVDAFADYNIGSTSNAYNLGVGITIR